MYYSKDKIDTDVIDMIADGVDAMLMAEEEYEKGQIIERRTEGKKVPANAVAKITERYIRIRQGNPILNLSKKMQELDKVTEDKISTDKLYSLIKETGNRIAIKGLAQIRDRYKSEGTKINDQANEILEGKKIERPLTPISLAQKEVRYISDAGEGFNITQEPMGADDAYDKVFRTAFSNQMMKLHSGHVVEQTRDPIEYIQDEMAELEDLEKFWGSDEFKKHVQQLQSKNPKEAQKYKRSHIKKREAVRQISKLYQEISQNRMSLDKIEQAFSELTQQKAKLPEKVYKKIHKSLTSQKEKELKKNRKLNMRKQRILGRTGLAHSINNAKKYKDVADKLKSLNVQQKQIEELEEIRESLREAKKKLNEEYDRSNITPEENVVEVKGGDARETGEIKPSSRTNDPAIREAEAKVAELQRKLAQQEEGIARNRKAKANLETEIEEINEGEVKTTIKIPDSKALSAGTQSHVMTDSRKVFAKGLNFDGINHERAMANMGKDEPTRADKSLEGK